MMDNRQLRDALGRFATGICVVTAAPEGGAAVGMTVNSFSSVSLEPPLVLWSIQNSAECFSTFMQTPCFAVNVLSLDQEALSVRYARRSTHTLSAEHYAPGRHGAPLLKGALASFECKTWARYPGGDHEIIVGEVVDLYTRPTGKPLLFHQGQYAQLR